MKVPEVLRQTREIARALRDRGCTIELIAGAVGIHARTDRELLSRFDVRGHVAAIEKLDRVQGAELFDGTGPGLNDDDESWFSRYIRS